MTPAMDEQERILLNVIANILPLTGTMKVINKDLGESTLLLTFEGAVFEVQITYIKED